MRGERDLVVRARVVEARGEIDDEAHLPAYGKHPPDHAVAMCRLARARRAFRETLGTLSTNFSEAV